MYGVGWTLAASLAVLLVLGLADYFIRYQDPGLRVIASAILLGVVGYAIYVFLVRPLAHTMRDVEIARRIERLHPNLNERLSSAIDFLKGREADRAAGSPQLRRAVVAQATSEMEAISLDNVVDPRPGRRALLGAGAVGLVCAILAVADPASARIALARLAAPWGAMQWPQQNELQFIDPPTRLAVGQPFEVELEDRQGRLPDEVRIHYRFEVDGEWTHETEVMQPLGDRMLAHRDAVARPFEYRAEGGDDRSMEWTRLDVVEPPLVESFEVTLHPPAYTGFAKSVSEKRVRALKGTRAGIQAVATKPLASATLMLASGAEIPASIGADGHSFAISPEQFTIEDSGDYWFALVDSEQLPGGSENRWEIRAVTDAPPSVSFEQPGANIFVTPDATVAFRVLVKDNLAIRSVAMHFTRSDQSDQGEFIVPLFEGPAEPPSLGDANFASGADLGESRIVEYSWTLAELDLEPGVQLAANVQASDYVPQVGQSLAPRRITIISAAELEDRLASRQTFILSELARALKMQREARSQTTDLEIQLREVGALAKADIDILQSAELNQRQVTRTLTSRTEGVPAHVENLLADLESNKVSSPDILRRMTGLLRELDRLGSDHLPVVHSGLTGALKAAQAELETPHDEGEPSAAQPPLGIATGEQDHVIETLERLLGDLSQWADYRRFARDVRAIHTEQKAIEARTRAAGADTLTRELNDLSPQQRAELQKLGQGQLELGRRLDKVLQGMERMGAELAEPDPLAAATLEDALHLARSEGLSGKMREAGRGVEQNQIGQSLRDQEQLGAKLEQLLDILSNRREHELERLVAKLRQAEQELDQLRAQQRGLQKKLGDAAKISDEEERKRELQRLTKQQKQLQEEIERLARKLKRLQADRAGRSAERGAQKLGQSGQAGERGDASGAAGQAKGAQKDLDDAQAQLAEARRRAEEDLARERMAQLEDNLRSLRDQQQRVLDDTMRLEGQRQAAGQLNRDAQVTLQNTALLEEMLTEQTREMADKMESVPVFRAALSGAADDLNRAAQLLLRGRTGGDVQRAETAGLSRINQLLAALADDEDEPEGQQGDEPTSGQGGGGQSGGQKLHDIAELKLLKLMQQDVNVRTNDLQRRLTDAPQPTADELQEQDQLSAEQGQLADLVYNLLKTEGDPDDPEQLPELDLDGEPDGLPDFDLGGESQEEIR
jgi:hypothetical protein